MKYQNAQDLLPEELLREVQKYISGTLVYIPAQEQRREWGSVSGYRQFLTQRNQQIRARFAIGETITNWRTAAISPVKASNESFTAKRRL